MSPQLDRKRIGIFLAIAFGLAWVLALVIYLTGGLVNSPVLIPDTPITLALVLLATGYMWAPTIANILTRLITGEGRADLYLQPQLKRGWPFWLAAWLGPVVATLGGAAVFFVLFPQYFDPDLTALRELIATQTGQDLPAETLRIVILAQTGQAIFLAPIINGLFTFGEEFGWRAYLQPKLLPLGPRKTMLLMGLIWGVWHWPIIAMGHNYGLEYPGYPWVGLLAMVWFCFVTGTFLGWATLRAGSVWPAVIGHAVINGISAIGGVFVQGEPHPALGPLPVGLIGAVVWALFTFAILLWPGALTVPPTPAPPAPPEQAAPPHPVPEQTT